MKRILVLLAALACAAAAAAATDLFGFPADRWGRHPVKIYINAHDDVYKFHDLGVSIEALRDGYIEASVTPEKLKELLAKSWRVEPRIEEPVSPDIVAAYHNYDWLTARLDSVHAQYPSITRKVSMGSSQQGRQQWAFLITDHPDSAENEAEVRFTATIHGDEPVGTEMSIALIDSLTQGYGIIPEIADLVDNREIWFVPMYNPDGNTLGQRALANGVDPNRNYPVPDGSIGGDGTYANYVETQNFINFWSPKRAVLSGTFHGGALIANYPWDYKDSVGNAPTDPPDLFLARQISLGYSRLNQPMYINPAPGAPYDSGVIYGYTWYPVYGSLQDWSYHATSCLDITLEISAIKWPAASTLPGFWSDNRAAMLYFIRQAGWGVQGVVTDFSTGLPINRVQVDVGGINKSVYTDSLAGDYHRMLMTGNYNLTFSKTGYTSKTVNNVRVKLDSVTNLNVALSPLQAYTYMAHDTINIPDNGAWIEDSLFVDRSLALADYEVYVNITHPHKGDLAVRVFAPSGDSLRLHQRSGGSADNIIGWYDTELTPADNQRWAAFVGLNSHGYWRLRAKDFASSDIGRLNGWGLQIFSTDTGVEGWPPGPARSPALFLSNRPNPFGKGTVITYSVTGAGEQRVELAIYNISGQRVHILASGMQSPAKYLLEWDGRDDRGRKLPAGVYLARLQTAGSSATRRMILVQ